MQEHDGLALGVSGLLPVHALTVAGEQLTGLIGLDRRVQHVVEVAHGHDLTVPRRSRRAREQRVAGVRNMLGRMTAAVTTITLTGAGGQIGYALLFRIAAGDMLGPDRPVRLRLLEIRQGLRAAEGAALELADGAFDLLHDVEVTEDPAVAFDGCNIALLVLSLIHI